MFDREADRIEAALAKTIPDTVVTVASSPVGAETVGRLLALFGEGTGVRALSIARDKSKTADERMEALVRLDNRFDVNNRPSLTVGRDEFTYYPGLVRIPEGAAPDTKNKSWQIKAAVVIPKSGAEGMLLTHGGRFAG